MSSVLTEPRRRNPHPRTELLLGIRNWITSRAYKHSANIPNRFMGSDDLSQEAAIAVLTRPTGHDPARSSACHWGAMITQSVASRVHKQSHLYANRFLDSERATESECQQPVLAPQSPPDEEIGESDEQAYLFALLGELIGELPDDERAVITYRYLSCPLVPSFTETARVLYFNHGTTVKALEESALARIRERLMEHTDDFDDDICDLQDRIAA